VRNLAADHTLLMRFAQLTLQIARLADTARNREPLWCSIGKEQREVEQRRERQQPAAGSSAMMVTSITRLTAANERAAPPKPFGLGSSRLTTVPAAMPAMAGTMTTEARTSRLSSGRRCHW
jgi:hypothetical protein